MIFEVCLGSSGGSVGGSHGLGEGEFSVPTVDEKCELL